MGYPLRLSDMLGTRCRLPPGSHRCHGPRLSADTMRPDRHTWTSGRFIQHKGGARGIASCERRVLGVHGVHIEREAGS